MSISDAKLVERMKTWVYNDGSRIIGPYLILSWIHGLTPNDHGADTLPVILKERLLLSLVRVKDVAKGSKFIVLCHCCLSITEGCLGTA